MLEMVLSGPRGSNQAAYIVFALSASRCFHGAITSGRMNFNTSFTGLFSALVPFPIETHLWFYFWLPSEPSMSAHVIYRTRLDLTG